MPGSRLRRFRASAPGVIGSISAAALGVVALAAVPASGSAAAQFRIGGHGVYEMKFQDGTFGVGGRAEVALDFLFRGLALAGTYDRLFPSCEACSSWQAGGQLVLGGGPLYVGLAGSFHRFDPGPDYEPPEGLPPTGVTEEWGVNVVVGVRVPQVPVVTPVVEFRQQVGSSTGNRQTIVAGILFSPPGRRNAPRPPRGGQPRPPRAR